MNDQSPVNDSEPLERREEHPTDQARGGSWVAGIILIVLGGMFLMRNIGTFEIPLKNWWALFILIPAVGSFENAVRLYRNAGNQLEARARSALLMGLFLTFITIMFLFDVSWTLVGPILIILVGAGILLNNTIFSRQ